MPYVLCFSEEYMTWHIPKISGWSTIILVLTNFSVAYLLRNMSLFITYHHTTLVLLIKIITRVMIMIMMLP